MGAETGIQWADGTVNPTSGCDGCELWPDDEKRGPCYAGNLHTRRLSKTLPHLYSPNFADVRMIPGRMAKAASLSDLRGKPRKNKPWVPIGMPRMIFVGDLGDVFSKAVTFEFLKEELIDVAMEKAGLRHVWQVLTKRPSRLVKFAEWLRSEHGIGWPSNVWSGTSVTGKASVDRIRHLLPMPGIRFVSMEPLVEDIGVPWELMGDNDLQIRGIDQVIIGGESKQGSHEVRSFNLDWPRKIIRQLAGSSVAVFVKQLGSKPHDGVGLGLRGDGTTNNYLGLKDGHGGDWGEWPSDLRVREFPTTLL